MEGGRAGDTIYHQSRDPNKTLSEEVDSGPPKPISLAGSNVRLWHKTEVPPAGRDFRFRGHNGHQNRGSRLPLVPLRGV